MRFVFLIVVALGIVGCKTSSGDSAIRVRDGIKATVEDYRAVVKLDFTDGHFCSGTYLNQTVVLTAAHCLFDHNHKFVRPMIDGVEPDNIVLADRNFGDALLKFHEDLKTLSGSNVIHDKIVAFTARDIALLSFKGVPASRKGIEASDLPVIWSPHRPGAGTPVTVVGYGLTGKVNMEKHYGNNKIDDVREGAIIIACGEGDTVEGDRVQGDDSCADKGDSGGALFRARGTGVQREIIHGVISFNPPGGLAGYSYYANLGSPTAAALFAAAHDLGFERMPILQTPSDIGVQPTGGEIP